jgi:hypothetical protein
MSQILHGQQVDDLNGSASRYESKVFSESNNVQDYLRTIYKKMMYLQKKWPLVVQAASHLRQQQAQMGQQQMRHVDAVPANSSGATMPQTASAIPLPVRPSQEQSMHSRVNEAQPAKLPQAAPVVQHNPCNPTVVNLTQALCAARHNSTQQPQPNLTRMNQQTPNGQQANVAIMQTRQSGGQNNEQFGNPHPAGEVDWREDMFQKITSLKDAHWSELMEFGRELHPCVLRMKAKGEQKTQYRYAQNIMESIKRVLRFLQIQKTNIPEAAKDKLDMWQNAIRDLLTCYSAIKARCPVMLRRTPDSGRS